MPETCPHCGGTGQQCYFKGESRFLLSWYECPACCGTGYRLEAGDPAPDRPPDSPADREHRSRGAGPAEGETE